MLLVIKNLYKDNALYIAVFVTVSIAMLSLSEVSPIKPVFRFAYIDKVQHFTAYFVLTLSWLFTAQKSGKQLSYRFWVVLTVFLYGVLMEFFQQIFTDFREADIYDVLANSSGIILGLLFFEKIIHQKFKEFLATS